MASLPFEIINRKVIIKSDATTNDRYGCRPDERTTKDLLNSCVICINKNQGPSSHQVADYVKRILNAKKVGHGGTLDPNVWGVLPMGVEDATRIMQTVLKGGKEYVALMYLHKDVSEKEICSAVNKFIGKIKQIPPIKSAVRRVERIRNIYYFEILEINGRYVLFKVGCEAGTYIRKLIDQFGRELKTGAHMQQLIRTKAGPFSDREWHSLTDLKDAYTLYKEEKEEELRKIIKPIEYAVSHLGKIWVFDSAVNNLCHGSQLYATGIAKLNSGIKPGDMVAVLTLKEELICIGYSAMDSEEIVNATKGLAVRTSRVFMKPDLYPKNID